MTMIGFIACLAALATTMTSVSPAAKSIISLLETRYRTARTLQASFLESYSENGRLVRVESGTAYFRRPGKMRWEYQSPEKNLFLVDGKNAWFYVPSDHTVTRVPAKNSSDWRTPLALLAGEMKVSRVCAAVWPAVNEKPETSENVVLYCALPGHANSAKSTSREITSQTDDAAGGVLFEVARKSGDLVRILVQDPAGVAIEFRFANWLADPPIADSLFHFSAPPGVAIVNGELPGGQKRVNP
jgi:outer membrane lipoprotein carrier protein